jgi:hypothetical protein
MLDYATVFPASGESISAVIVDVGLGGLQLRSKEPLELGEEFSLVIGRNDEMSLTMHCVVRNCRPIDGELHAVGVNFRPHSHDERIAIAEYVHTVFQRQGEKLVS